MTTEAETTAAVKLDGMLLFKIGMTSIYQDSGELVPVTVLRYEPLFVSQIKTKEKDGYSAVQVSCVPTKTKNTPKAIQKRLARSGFESGARYSAEIRQEFSSEAPSVGQRVDINSFSIGESVKLTGTSKGRGFMGSVRRWNFAGGPGSHGSKFHRTPGSSGNRTWPGRVMPGKKFPGHWGNETVSVKNVQVVKILAEENLLMVKGPVPGARNSIVKLVKG